MSTRRRAREVAMQALYQFDQNPQTDPAQIRQFVKERLRFPELENFAQSLIDGVRSHRVELDKALTDAAKNWTVSRMAPIDRNVLRIAVFELLHRPDTPPKAIIDEAIELCKRYSTSESGSFINGILDRIASLSEKA